MRSSVAPGNMDTNKEQPGQVLHAEDQGPWNVTKLSRCVGKLAQDELHAGLPILSSVRTGRDRLVLYIYCTTRMCFR